jgi:hypothetical protein
MGNNTRASPLGEALAEAAQDPRAFWAMIVAQFAAIENASLPLMGGFLSGLMKRDAALANSILDEATEHPALAPRFPILQACVTVDAMAVGRLRRTLELGKAAITTYNDLAYGRVSDNLSGSEFRDLVLDIARKPGGCPVALHMISMRLHSDGSAKRKPLPEVREAGRIVLISLNSTKKITARCRTTTSSASWSGLLWAAKKALLLRKCFVASS